MLQWFYSMSGSAYLQFLRLSAPFWSNHGGGGYLGRGHFFKIYKNGEIVNIYVNTLEGFIKIPSGNDC